MVHAYKSENYAITHWYKHMCYFDQKLTKIGSIRSREIILVFKSISSKIKSNQIWILITFFLIDLAPNLIPFGDRSVVRKTLIRNKGICTYTFLYISFGTNPTKKFNYSVGQCNSENCWWIANDFWELCNVYTTWN